MKNIAFIPFVKKIYGSDMDFEENISGKPLFYWTVSAASYCKSIDAVLLMTDDNKLYEKLNSFEFNNAFPVLISKERSESFESAEDAMIELIKSGTEGFDNIFLINPYNPLISSNDLANAMILKKENNLDSVLSVVEQNKFIWVSDKKETVEAVNYDYRERKKYEDYKGHFIENESFYLTEKRFFIRSRNRISGRIGCYEMPFETQYDLNDSKELVEKILFETIKKELSSSLDIKLVIVDMDNILRSKEFLISKENGEIQKFNYDDIKILQQVQNIKFALFSDHKDKHTYLENLLGKEVFFNNDADGIKRVQKIIKEDFLKKENVLLLTGVETSFIKVSGVVITTDNSSENVKINSDFILKKDSGEGVLVDVFDIFDLKKS